MYDLFFFRVFVGCGLLWVIADRCRSFWVVVDRCGPLWDVLGSSSF